MKRSQERFLTTHVGSLIRPDQLNELSEAARTAEPGAADGGAQASYQRGLAAAVAEVAARQAKAGLDVVNDGEYGKSSWSAYVLDRISGFEIRADRMKPLDWLGRDRERFRGFFTASDELPALTGAPAEVCVGPIAYVGHAEIARDLANLTAATAGLDGQEVFFTSVAPASTAYQGVNEHYASEEEYVYAIADALRQEYLAIHQAGFILQVDDAVLANMYDHIAATGEDNYRRWAQLRVDALNHALRGIPPDRVRYHVCYGSWHVPHVADAPLDAIIDFILQVNAGAYSIEAANPRHEWEWEVWQRAAIGEDKILIPGVITHHTTTVEHPQTVAQRIERFAAAVGPQSVIAGADCGFAQGSRIRRTHPDVMWAKFESLVAGADIASKRVFGAR